MDYSGNSRHYYCRFHQKSEDSALLETEGEIGSRASGTFPGGHVGRVRRRPRRWYEKLEKSWPSLSSSQLENPITVFSTSEFDMKLWVVENWEEILLMLRRSSTRQLVGSGE